MTLKGTYTALLTPFTTGGEEVDYVALKNLIAYQVNAGIEGLVPCGTTGESPTLDHKEHREVIARVVEWSKSIRNDIVVIAGTGSNSTREAIDLTKAAVKDGADYALLVNPYYNKPTQSGLVAHFLAIAEASTIPLVLYNIPGRTNVTLSLNTIKELSKHPNIAGIKEATGDLNFMSQVILETPEDFFVLSGDDNLTLPLLATGGRGVISVVSNIFPRSTGEITRKFFNSDFAGAKKIFQTLFPFCNEMFVETNPIPVKYAASLLGLCKNELRLPMTPISESLRSGLKSKLEEIQKVLGEKP